VGGIDVCGKRDVMFKSGETLRSPDVGDSFPLSGFDVPAESTVLGDARLQAS